MVEEIDSIHAEWSRTDKGTRMPFLKGRWKSLNRCPSQLGEYLCLKGTICQDERERAQRLIEMMDEVYVEGIKTQKELANECMQEIIMKLMLLRLHPSQWGADLLEWLEDIRPLIPDDENHLEAIRRFLLDRRADKAN